VRVSFSPDGADALRTETDEPTVALGMSDGWDEIVDGLLADGDVVVTKRHAGLVRANSRGVAVIRCSAGCSAGRPSGL
jgi:hypothetical protein